jgi:hypothetical protein
MNAQELKNFLADSPPSTVNLEIKKHFEALTDQQARYAHYISRYFIPMCYNSLGVEFQSICLSESKQGNSLERFIIEQNPAASQGFLLTCMQIRLYRHAHYPPSNIP